MFNLHCQRLHLACCQPAHARHLVKLGLVVDHHGQVVVVANDLYSVSYEASTETHMVKVGAELANEKLRVALEQGDEQTVELGNVIAVALRG